VNQDYYLIKTQQNNQVMFLTTENNTTKSFVRRKMRTRTSSTTSTSRPPYLLSVFTAVMSTFVLVNGRAETSLSSTRVVINMDTECLIPLRNSDINGDGKLMYSEFLTFADEIKVGTNPNSISFTNTIAKEIFNDLADTCKDTFGEEKCTDDGTKSLWIPQTKSRTLDEEFFLSDICEETVLIFSLVGKKGRGSSGRRRPKRRLQASWEYGVNGKGKGSTNSGSKGKGKVPSAAPSDFPSLSAKPSNVHSEVPSLTGNPSAAPSEVPSLSGKPSNVHSEVPSLTGNPSAAPSEVPSLSGKPSNVHSEVPSLTGNPSAAPSEVPSLSGKPSNVHSEVPSLTGNPSAAPSEVPSLSGKPSNVHSEVPSLTGNPSPTPSVQPTWTTSPSAKPSPSPTTLVTLKPTSIAVPLLLIGCVCAVINCRICFACFQRHRKNKRKAYEAIDFPLPSLPQDDEEDFFIEQEC
jgi:hypothetical protein